MATFLLRPQNGGKDITIPAGKTTIGRGPFLGVSDKRVSRSHAVLELTDGKLTVLPLHTNPTFYKATEKEKFVSLKKDETKCLSNGNVISLLPDSLCFVVICEGSLEKNGLTKEEAEISKSKARENVPSATDVTVAKDQKKPLTSPKEPTESFLDEFMDDRPSLQTFPAPATRAACADVSITDSKESIDDPAPSSSSFVSKKETALPSKPLVEPAPLLQKTRKLPSWLTQSTSETKSPAKKTGNNKGKTPASGTAKTTAASNNGGKSTQKATSSAQRKQKTSDPDEDFVVSNEEEKQLQQKGKVKTTTKKRTSTNLDDSDEDIIPKTNKKAKRKSRDLDSESDDEDIPVRPERQDISKPVKPVSRDESSGSDDDDIKPASKKRVEAKTPGKDTSKATKLPVCPYGSKCYRKNPAHFKEYTHPSKDDANDDGEAAAEDSEDDRPECPYGTSCYRRNPQHKRDFKHTETPGRSKRKKAKHKSVLDDTSDDDGPNTYDYNDSFLDNDGEGSGSSYSASDDSDWQPQGADDDDDDVDEDVNELLTEARGFLRSKNMTKPV
ncbi:hypothetical protein ACROYT_G040357 [Oculina patagonica]